MEFHIYLFLAAMLAIAMLGLMLFHAYDVTTDKSVSSGSAELLTSSTICIKSAILSTSTTLSLFLFTVVAENIQLYVMRLMVWQTVFSMLSVTFFLSFALYKMKQNSEIDFIENRFIALFAIAFSLILAGALTLFNMHFLNPDGRKVLAS